MSNASTPEELFRILIASAPRVRTLRGDRAAFQVGKTGEIALAELECIWAPDPADYETRLRVISNFAALPGYQPPDGKRGSVPTEIKTAADVYAAIGRAAT
jgi:hypothetical protein